MGALAKTGGSTVEPLKNSSSGALPSGSLTSSRKSMPMMTKVNFGDEGDTETVNAPAPSKPPLESRPYAGRTVSARTAKSTKLKPAREADESEEPAKSRYMSTASLAKKKISQQGKTARVEAAIRKSMGDGLQDASAMPFHQSAPAIKNRVSVPGDSGKQTSGTAGAGASEVIRNSGVLLTRASQASPRESIERPIIHMYPRKSVMSGNNMMGTGRHSAGARDEMEIRKHMVNSQSKSSFAAAINTNIAPPEFDLDDGKDGRQVQQTSYQDEQDFPQQIALRDENPEYYDYVMLSQRHASSNFITKIGSGEIDYGTPETVIKIIGPYVMGDQIGKGAYGKVKEGLCAETLQRVAIKIINKKRLRKIPNGVENALSEIALLRRMKHRNVIMLIDVYCKVEDEEGNYGIFNWFPTIEDEPITWTYEDGSASKQKVVVLKWYLVFEYCPCSLQTLLEQSEGKKLSIFKAHKFFVQLIDSLAYLHSQSIIHRDIKAGNLLVTPDGIIKLSDFGVAEQFSMYQGGEMLSDLFAGTHQFMAPEICDGQGKFLAAKVDIWACGVTLYNMITGRYPFEFPDDGNLLGLYERIVLGEFEMPTGIESDLESLLQGLLCKDPVARFSMTQIQNHPWYLAFFQENQRPQPPILSYPSCDFAQPDMGASLKPTPLSDAAAAAVAAATTAASVDGSISPNTLTGSSADPVTSNSNELLKKKKAQKKAKYQSIISLHQKETPCTTTMIPYLAEICGREIEEELITTKRFIDMVGREDDVQSRSMSAEVASMTSGMSGDDAVSMSVDPVFNPAELEKGVSDKERHGPAKSEGSPLEGKRQKKKPLKMFFKNLFHHRDGSVVPK
ncbi:Serine/threonine-protein kinase STK11 [Podochytrium sp. JEL0797]|nr:Serine/threonine-protein kinase STK11 [Podochytrium sp. JEL0797]